VNDWVKKVVLGLCVCVLVYGYLFLVWSGVFFFFFFFFCFPFLYSGVDAGHFNAIVHSTKLVPHILTGDSVIESDGAAMPVATVGVNRAHPGRQDSSPLISDSWQEGKSDAIGHPFEPVPDGI
jgi:hypothetical protein